ncbi:hypothetical protein [Pseudarthrobacter sp. BIM B-2242]|uniref:hypothetical protein n=1 Tax=Pseudarthrobacter sp. BIM B-2242 TaxID=2772401 RepID=UPI00168BAF63|nr:hypothetical protein [Pseudarthrobacter sp. BIM B-2242]QOD05971.1 hypothetical protein IDT60_20595 [Pseudarthrobacter sp. BIM B-2242]
MRTLDRKYLATHPAGEEPAVFEVSIDLPASVDVPNNPDGTRPQVTLKATSDTYANLLGILGYVHGVEVGQNIVMLVVENADERKMAKYETVLAAAPYLREAAAEMVTPFRTFTQTLELQTSEDENSMVTASLEITAPSITHAGLALKSMTRPHVLNELAISFSPETQDDDDLADNHVLVVS